ncbi:alpha-1,6-mannosyltransferase subunit [Phyllosticta capitalensis]|uniref:Mannosyltransferase n=1 Tax=Phyllosticta capitalensis TaxID=121624 RepID=A0ABR1YYU6_9PEZI
MNPILESFITLILPTVILIHLFWAPFTKVEESFNIQAIHDILAHGIPLRNSDEEIATKFDHFSFPGSVPRTFVGALLVSGLSWPWRNYIRSPAQTQMLARMVLGLYNAFTLLSLRSTVSKVFGKTAGIWFVLFHATQFHIMYYASRTLPNMYALGLSNLALRFYLDSSTTADTRASNRNLRLSFYLLTIAGIIFRSELALYLATLALHQLLKRVRSSGLSGLAPYLRVVIPAGLSGAVVALAITIPVDTFFWRTYPAILWPEWVAFTYNTIQGHASDWGVSPWHYYLFNALPRLLLNPLIPTFLLPFSLLNPATRGPSFDLVAPSVAFVALYSALPHKEWRFVIYVVPALTASAAASASYLWTRRAKSLLYRALSLALVGSLAFSAVASTALLAISSTNYPGGAALTRLGPLAAASTPDSTTLGTSFAIAEPENGDSGDQPHVKRAVQVHLDNLVCQTGATQFLSDTAARILLPPLPLSAPEKWAGKLEMGLETAIWHFDKTNNATALLDPAFWDAFDFALVENIETAIGKWEVVDVIEAFGGVAIVRPNDEFGGADDASEKVKLDQEGNGKGDTSRVRGFGQVLFGEESWIGDMEKLVRGRLTKGWWIGVKMVPKVRILRRVRG